MRVAHGGKDRASAATRGHKLDARLGHARRGRRNDRPRFVERLEHATAFGRECAALVRADPTCTRAGCGVYYGVDSPFGDVGTHDDDVLIASLERSEHPQPEGERERLGSGGSAIEVRVEGRYGDTVVDRLERRSRPVGCERLRGLEVERVMGQEQLVPAAGSAPHRRG